MKKPSTQLIGHDNFEFIEVSGLSAEQTKEAYDSMVQELIVSMEIMELCIDFMKEQDLSHKSILNQIENNKKALKKAGCTNE